MSEGMITQLLYQNEFSGNQILGAPWIIALPDLQ